MFLYLIEIFCLKRALKQFYTVITDISFPFMSLDLPKFVTALPNNIGSVRKYTFTIYIIKAVEQ